MLDEINQCFIYDDEIIPLRKEQTELLAYLISRKYARTSIEQISEELYGMQPDEYITVCIYNKISRLNRKLKGILSIHAKSKMGYIIEYGGVRR